MTDASSIPDFRLSRRDFFKVSAMVAGAGTHTLPAVAQDGAARAAVIPLFEFLKTLQQANQAINSTLPPAVRYFNTSDPKPASYARPFIFDVAEKAKTLLAEHPAAQQVLDGFFTARKSIEYDMLLCHADFILQHPDAFAKTAREAAFHIKRHTPSLSNQQFRDCCNTVVAHINHRDKTDPVLSKAYLDMSNHIIRIGQQSMQRCVDFMHSMGLSKERKPQGYTGPGDHRCVLPGFVRSSEAENFYGITLQPPHIPMRNLSVLTDGARLLQALQMRYPSLNPAIRHRTDAVDIDTDNIEFPEIREASQSADTQKPVNAPDMTADEFIQQFADHPNIVAALGNGTHVDRLARNLGISLQR